MTVEGYTEENGAQDDSMDSPVMKALRKQIRDLEKQLSSTPTRESIEAEVEARYLRRQAIQAELIQLGVPTGIGEFLEGKLGEAEVNTSSVTDLLRGIGFSVGEAGVPDGNGEEQQEANSQLAKVASLSAQVSTSSSGGPANFLDRINSANSPAELEAILKESGEFQPS